MLRLEDVKEFMLEPGNSHLLQPPERTPDNHNLGQQPWDRDAEHKRPSQTGSLQGSVYHDAQGQGDPDVFSSWQAKGTSHDRISSPDGAAVPPPPQILWQARPQATSGQAHTHASSPSSPSSIASSGELLSQPVHQAARLLPAQAALHTVDDVPDAKSGDGTSDQRMKTSSSIRILVPDSDKKVAKEASGVGPSQQQRATSPWSPLLRGLTDESAQQRATSPWSPPQCGLTDESAQQQERAASPPPGPAPWGASHHKTTPQQQERAASPPPGPAPWGASHHKTTPQQQERAASPPPGPAPWGASHHKTTPQQQERAASPLPGPAPWGAPRRQTSPQQQERAASPLPGPAPWGASHHKTTPQQQERAASPPPGPAPWGASHHKTTPQQERAASPPPGPAPWGAPRRQTPIASRPIWEIIWQPPNFSDRRDNSSVNGDSDPDMVCDRESEVDGPLAALLELGAFDPNAPIVSGGITPMHLACASGRAGRVMMLLQNGARLDVKDECGRDAIEYAELAGLVFLARTNGLHDIALSVQPADGRGGQPRDAAFGPRHAPGAIHFWPDHATASNPSGPRHATPVNIGPTPASRCDKGFDGGASEEGSASPSDHQSSLRASAAAAAASASARAEQLAAIQELVGTEHCRGWFAEFVESQDFIWESMVARVLTNCPEASEYIPTALQQPPSGSDIHDSMVRDRQGFLRRGMPRDDAAQAHDRRVPIPGDRIKDDPRAIRDILARISGRKGNARLGSASSPSSGPGWGARTARGPKTAYAAGGRRPSATQGDRVKPVTSCGVPVFSPGFMSAIRYCERRPNLLQGLLSRWCGSEFANVRFPASPTKRVAIVEFRRARNRTLIAATLFQAAKAGSLLAVQRRLVGLQSGHLLCAGDVVVPWGTDKGIGSDQNRLMRDAAAAGRVGIPALDAVSGRIGPSEAGGPPAKREECDEQGKVVRRLASPLMASLVGGHVACALALLRRARIDTRAAWLIDAQDSKGETALHYAARCGNASATARILEARLPSRLPCSLAGLNPAHVAAACGATDVLLLLLQHDSACLGHRDNDGFLPLHYAAARSDVRCVIASLLPPVSRRPSVGVLPDTSLLRAVDARLSRRSEPESGWGNASGHDTSRGSNGDAVVKLSGEALNSAWWQYSRPVGQNITDDSGWGWHAGTGCFGASPSPQFGLEASLHSHAPPMQSPLARIVSVLSKEMGPASACRLAAAAEGVTSEAPRKRDPREFFNPTRGRMLGRGDGFSGPLGPDESARARARAVERCPFPAGSMSAGLWKLARIGGSLPGKHDGVHCIVAEMPGGQALLHAILDRQRDIILVTHGVLEGFGSGEYPATPAWAGGAATFLSSAVSHALQQSGATNSSGSAGMSSSGQEERVDEGMHSSHSPQSWIDRAPTDPLELQVHAELARNVRCMQPSRPALPAQISARVLLLHACEWSGNRPRKEGSLPQGWAPSWLVMEARERWLQRDGDGRTGAAHRARVAHEVLQRRFAEGRRAARGVQEEVQLSNGMGWGGSGGSEFDPLTMSQARDIRNTRTAESALVTMLQKQNHSPEKVQMGLDNSEHSREHLRGDGRRVGRSPPETTLWAGRSYGGFARQASDGSGAGASAGMDGLARVSRSAGSSGRAAASGRRLRL